MKEKICYIVGAGSFSEKLSPSAFDLVIACDGGYKYLMDQGIVPHIAMGDFDSLGGVPSACPVISHPPEKDDTDMMLCIKHGFEQGYRRFHIFGCLGGRLDHTLANLQALLWITKEGGEGYLIGEGSVITALCNSVIELPENCKGYLSVFPAYTEARGVTLEKLKYTLSGYTLKAENALGVSNEFTGESARIKVENGSVFCLWYENFTDRKGSVYENKRSNICP